MQGFFLLIMDNFRLNIIFDEGYVLLMTHERLYAQLLFYYFTQTFFYFLMSWNR